MPNNKKIKIYLVDATTRPTHQIIHISVKISQIWHNTCHIIYHTVYPLSMENASFSRKIQRCISNTTSKCMIFFLLSLTIVCRFPPCRKHLQNNYFVNVAHKIKMNRCMLLHRFKNSVLSCRKRISNKELLV